MKNRRFALLVFGLLVQGASAMAVAEDRTALKDVSTVRIANYGIPSTVIQDREKVRSIVEELRQLRNKAWRRADTQFSCYATLSLHSETRTVTIFRIRPDFVVERPQGKGQSIYSLAVNQADLPRISALLAAIPPAKDCAW